MDSKRRNLIKLISLGAILPGELLLTNFAKAEVKKTKAPLADPIAKLYKESHVIDGLVITRGWDEDSFTALKQSGYSGFNTSLASGSLKSALASLEAWRHRIAENQDRLLLASGANDFELAKQSGKVAVMPGFQNATMIEKSIDNIDKLYEAGTRWIQLTYNQRNLLGDGCTERTNAGLSDFGIEVVQRMNEIGIIVDLSHCGRQTTNDGIEFSNPGPCFTHTMCEALYPKHPRAKTDAQIKAMADKGGVMGVICLGYMIGPDPGGETTLDTYVDHLDHAVNIAGIDHVGLAADYAIQGLEADGATRENWYVPRLTRFKPSYEVRWPPWIPELDKPDRYLQVAKKLDQRGYKTGEIEKNFRFKLAELL
jgi:membrane dipeptidase